ncbi:aminoglycoside phosphotransferase family protein [Arenibacter sp. BSSL-BM3]|uniref:Aminoglycoside phosphotransferase family protein n=1 Tax=Arenibacter arenosicollis TaxID=2762274 RepID=A0ABR7QM85_9FLAO|nr:aminoglycoside phosphotransferase family protein [Arenibacter arenosicollis]MBC8768306.1 aminoglycoside phosphotransferase family protein [Arenibacter arenosicollis]
MITEKTVELNELLENFSIERKTYQFQGINQGYINDTYLVLDNNYPLYILQRVNHNVFKDVHGLMGNIANAFEFLQDQDYTPIDLLKTDTANSYYKHAKTGYWRLMTYINNTTAYDNATDTEIAFQAGKVVGKFHQLLANAPMDNYVDTIPQFHDLSLRQKQFEESLLSAKKEKLETSKAAIAFAKETLEKLRILDNSKLPLRVCHNDTKLNNILFSKEENKALCLIDLDTIMKGYFYFDFGDAIRTVANTAAEDEQDHDKITFEKPLFEAFVKGLESNGAFLYKEEIDLLAWGAVFMPFIHGLRALTDYLNDNIYYKVSYENQNLDRCLSLFDFTNKALQEIGYMTQVVKEGLTPID